MDKWITDTRPSARFPYYTRANADEVGPDPVSPLGWSLIWMQGCQPGVAKGFVEFGVVSFDEYDLDPLQVFGNWGGYFYNPLSLSRLMGERMPGVTAAAIDEAYFGDHPGVPPHMPHPDDEDAAATEKLGASMAWVMSTDSYPLQEAAAETARRVVAERPDLRALTDIGLVERARAMAAVLDGVWMPYCVVCLAASLGPGAVQAVCAAIGRPEDAVKAMAGLGNVESADSSFALWDLGRMVRRSAELTAAFDAGVDGVVPRIEATTGDGRAFHEAWARVLAVSGHRGPNEWDARSHSWTTRPQLALGLVDRLRHQDDGKSPHDARARAAGERQRVAAEIGETLAGDAEAAGTFAAGVKSAGVFLAMRETGKNACIRVIHEAKLALFELGRRMTERGVIAQPQEVFNLLDDELDAFLADPHSFSTTLAEREAHFQALHDRQPPYIVGLDRPAPPIDTWPPRHGTGTPLAEAGDVLQGGPGSAGTVTGTARVVLDPIDAPDLEPDDILVAPTTDPSWASLFLTVAGVVVNVGAVGSHAAIVCRELGVPCATSVVNATERIPDGAMITLDGSTGIVTIVDVPVQVGGSAAVSR
ncbi:MAG: PEP-utilizing enzyme [Ilumatobacteraceae bacterium]